MIIRLRFAQLLLIALLVGCSGSENNSVTQDLINGYYLSGLTELTGADGTVYRSAEIAYDPVSNTYEWTEYSSRGDVIFQDIGEYSDTGRLVRYERIRPWGISEFISTHNVENGLVTEIFSTDNKLVTFSYTASGSLLSRETRYGDRFEDRRKISTIAVYSHDELNRISSGSIRLLDHTRQDFFVNLIYHYNDVGQLTKIERERSHPAGYRDTDELLYDTQGNNTRRITRDSDGMIISEVIFEYKKSSRPVQNTRLFEIRFFGY